MPRKHLKKQKQCRCRKPCKLTQLWSETNWQPDAQWCPIIPIVRPLKTVKAPFYTSSEDPTPQWAPNIIIKAREGCSFLRTKCWQDNIRRHIYGTNPFSDTVNSGGIHFQ